MYHLSWCRE